MSKRIVVVSDLQVPFHDRKAVKAVIQCITDIQPDEVVLIGDSLDFPQPSRWNKDTRGEFERDIYEDVEYFKKNVFAPLRAGYAGPIKKHEGNHDERPRVYLERYAPALAHTDMFNIDKLLDFENFGVELLGAFYDIAPGWVSTHGHLGGIHLSNIAGNTATNAAKRFNKSVVMGHTHRLGIGSFTVGYDGKAKVLTGMEVGNLMDMRQAVYLKRATANWQQGFGLLTVDGQHVKPEIVRIEQRKFSVDGHTWNL